MYEREQREVERLKVRERFLKEQLKDTPRYQRARRFANEIIHLMRDFLPQDRDCIYRVEEHLLMTAFEANAEIICVPPELDTLNNGGRLGEHAHIGIPGIDANSGSLGHGLSIACGIVLPFVVHVPAAIMRSALETVPANPIVAGIVILPLIVNAALKVIVLV